MAESVPEAKSEYVTEFGLEFDFDSDAERFTTRDNTLEYLTPRPTTPQSTTCHVTSHQSHYALLWQQNTKP